MIEQSPASPPYEIRASSIHGAGVFAARPIRRGERLLEYRGERIGKAESERRGLALMEEARENGGAAVYIFSLDHEWDLDGAASGNEARLLNHSCDPNTEVWNEDNRLWIEARRDIRKGEELTYNYGFGLETWEDHPCRCGAACCVGYIVTEDRWPALRRALARREPQSIAGSRRARASRAVVTNGGRQTAPTP